LAPFGSEPAHRSLLGAHSERPAAIRRSAQFVDKASIKRFAE